MVFFFIEFFPYDHCFFVRLKARNTQERYRTLLKMETWTIALQWCAKCWPSPASKRLYFLYSVLRIVFYIKNVNFSNFLIDYRSESIESALEIKYEKFERNWLRLNALCDESIASVDKMAKIEHMLNDDSASRMELDGMRFSSAFKDQNDVNERVFKLVYQHLDNNAEIRNVFLTLYCLI